MERTKRAVLTETDVALAILKERKAPMHYKELIAEVLARLGETPANPGQRLAQVHTEINLDSRFVFVGKGMWGLASWSPKTNRSIAPTPDERNYQPKHSDYAWEDPDEEDVTDDESELLVPADDEEETEDDFPLDDEDELEIGDDEETDEDLPEASQYRSILK